MLRILLPQPIPAFSAKMADWTLRHWQNLASLDGHARKSQLKATRKQEEAAHSARSRPLVGKSFYLDLPRGKNLEFLAESVKKLGGVVECFLSKEVTCVVSSSQEARRERWMEKQSSSALKDAQAGSRPSAELKRGPLHKSIDTNLTSRGKKLLHKAIRGQDSTCGNSILATSRSWGVQIIHIDEMLSYIRLLSKKHSSTAKVKMVASGFQPSEVRLKAPFLKIEDESRQLRPFFQQFKNFPQLYFQPLRRHSPFQPPGTSSSSKAPESKRSPNELFPPSACCIMPKPQKGYCECCEEVFAELQTHLQSKRHKEFALDPSHYTLVDSILSQLTNDFVVSSSSPPLRVPPSACSGDYSEFHLEDYCMFAEGQTVNPEASALLLEDQDFLHLAELPIEMLLTPVPFGSLGSASEHHRLVASTRSEAAASAEADHGAVPQERGLLVQPAVLSRKRKLSGSLHGQARKKRALSKQTSNDRLLPDEKLLPGNQQAGMAGCPPNRCDSQMASRPLGFSAVPFSNLGPSHLTRDSLSSEPLAIDTGCLQDTVQQLGQHKVAALSSCQGKDACISWDFPSPSIESRSMSGFPMGKHIDPTLLGAVDQHCLSFLDISELAWCVTTATVPRP